MKGMELPLDIIWLDQTDFKIIHIENDLMPTEPIRMSIIRGSPAQICHR